MTVPKTFDEVYPFFFDPCENRKPKFSDVFSGIKKSKNKNVENKMVNGEIVTTVFLPVSARSMFKRLFFLMFTVTIVPALEY